MSQDVARRLLAAVFPAATAESLAETVSRLGAVQMDPVQVVAPAHLWTLSLRRGPTRAFELDEALGRGELLEAYTHARCLVALKDAPALVRDWRRRRAGNAAVRHGVEAEARYILKRLESEPNLAARDVLTTRRVQGGWDLGDARTAKATTVALDVLWAEGRLVVSGRGPEGKRYDLLARRHPDLDRLMLEMGVEDALYASLRLAARSWKVYRPAWASPGFGRGGTAERRRWHDWLESTGEVRREGEGSGAVYVHRSVPEEAEPPPERALLLAPLDNLLWSRPRLEALYGFRYRWEVYTPEAARTVGPYNMPVLFGDRFWGQADARVEAGRLRVRWHPGEGRRVPEAVREAGRLAARLAREIRKSGGRRG